MLTFRGRSLWPRKAVLRRFGMAGTSSGTVTRDTSGEVSPSLTTRSYLGLLALCVAGYAGSLRNGFMLDDYLVLFGASGVENKALADLFLSAQHAFYRPVGHLLLFGSHRLFGGDVTGYHLVNLGVLALIVCVAYAIAREISGSSRVAFLTAAFYAVHPWHAFLVNYVTASVIGTFVLAMEASFLALLWFLRSEKTRFLYASLALYMAALLSHEMAIVLPVAVVCVTHFVRRTPVLPLLRIATPYLLVTAAFLLFRSLAFPLAFQTSWGAMTFLRTPGRYLGFLGDLLAWYFARLVWPRDVLFLWTAWPEPRHAVISAATVAGAIAAAVYLFVRWRRRGVYAFSLTLFAAGFLPIAIASFTYCPQSSPIIEPHWFYFTSLGFFLLVALAVDRLWQSRGWRVGGVAAAVLLATLMTFLWQTNRRWRDEETYCRYWISLNDRDWTPFHGLGRARLRSGDARGAVNALEQALGRIWSAPPACLLADLGFAYSLAGDQKEALGLLALALRQDPEFAPAYDYLGQVAMKQGSYPLAVEAFGAATRLFPGSEAYRRNLDAARARLEDLRSN